MNGPIPLDSRYRRAAQLTAPKIAATIPALAIEGYWISPDRYFYLAERFEPSVGCVVEVPSIADCRTMRLQELLPRTVLEELVNDATKSPLDSLAWSGALFDMPDGATLALSVAGHDYLIDWHQRRVRSASRSAPFPALYSPDGRFACFVQGYDLWVKERSTGVTRALTADGARYHCYGQKSETGLSAVSYRNRPAPSGIWSRDSRWFLTSHIDERHVPTQALVQHAPPGGERPLLHEFRYCTPGDPLPLATYVAIHVASGRIIRFDDVTAPLVMSFMSFSDMAWFDAGNTPWFLRFDRYCRHVELIRLDLERGTGRVVLGEASAAGYLDLHSTSSARPNVWIVDAADEVIWYSERDGHGHLYLYDANSGTLKNRMTSGPWMVRDIINVDNARRRVQFLASGIEATSDPARRALCTVGFDGGGFDVLIAHDGDVALPRYDPGGLSQDRAFRPLHGWPGMSPAGDWAVVRLGSAEHGNRTQIVDLGTCRKVEIGAAVPNSDHVQIRHFDALAADGRTRVYGAMFLPSDFDANRVYPLVDSIYPGPQSAWQPQSWHPSTATQATTLAELGMVTIMLDTRGAPIVSREFHQAGYGELLEPQLADHAAVVRHLCRRHAFLDSNRVGIIGESGGGSAAARALLDYGEVFKVGVSVCGNHDSTFYVSHWSDKYRGPDSGDGWHSQSNGSAAHKLEGKLLLISGDMDENVLVSHTFRLVDALIRANKDFDLLIAPNEGHSVLLTNGYIQRRVWDFFVTHLLQATAPLDFSLTYQPHEVARMWKVIRRGSC